MSNTSIPFDDVVTGLNQIDNDPELTYLEAMSAFQVLYRDHTLIERIPNPDGTVSWVFVYTSPSPAANSQPPAAP